MRGVCLRAACLWLWVSSLAQAQWTTGFGPAAFPSAAPSVQPDRRAATPSPSAGALPLPPLSPEIETEAVYLPHDLRQAGAPPMGGAPIDPRTWSQQAFHVHQAAHWPPVMPAASQLGTSYSPQAVQQAPVVGGQAIQLVNYQAPSPYGMTGGDVGPAPQPWGLPPAGGPSYSLSPHFQDQILPGRQPSPFPVSSAPPATPGYPKVGEVGGPSGASGPPPGVGVQQEPRRLEFNYVNPPEPEAGTSVYMAQFDATDDATKDERRRARAWNFLETGVAGESRPQAGSAGRRGQRKQPSERGQ
jgi:hypothetical protein